MKKTIFYVSILVALLFCSVAISIGSENKSQLCSILSNQSFFEKQANQSHPIMFERQARSPLQGCTRIFSSNKSTIVTANICPCNLSDFFDLENSSLWLKSDWQNIDPVYLNAWLPDSNHINISDGNLCLTLDNEPCIDDVSLCHGQDFASGQYFTACDNFRYGSLSARIMAGKGDGVITSMYLFEDGVAAGEQDEIDIEIFGKNSIAPGIWEMQTNYFRQGDMGDCWEPYGVPEPCHVGVIPLNFDPTQTYHNYTISWIGEGETCTEINWHVDEKLRRHVWLDENGYIHSTIFDESGNIIESSDIYQGSLPNSGCRIILGLWAAQNWDLAGQFNYISPITAKFDWMTFYQPDCASDQIGIYRNGIWYLDYNGDLDWDSSDASCWFGSNGDLPVAGDWNSDCKDEIAIFRNGIWYFDLNSNLAYDSGDVSSWFGSSGDLPVAGDWNGEGTDEIAIFRNGIWYFDLNGNLAYDSSDVSCWFGSSGDLPVAGDWNRDGKDEIAIYRNGIWYFDLNGNLAYDSADASCWFGSSGDLPVAGDWNGEGTDEIAIFRNGIWYFDLNGNLAYDSSDVSCWFGSSIDKPLAGYWS